MLLDDPNDAAGVFRYPALVDILPTSLRKLTINLHYLTDQERDLLFENWQQRKNVSLPNIQCINYLDGTLDTAIADMVVETDVRIFKSSEAPPVSPV